MIDWWLAELYGALEEPSNIIHRLVAVGKLGLMGLLLYWFQGLQFLVEVLKKVRQIVYRFVLKDGQGMAWWRMALSKECGLGLHNLLLLAKVVYHQTSSQNLDYVRFDLDEMDATKVHSRKSIS